MTGWEEISSHPVLFFNTYGSKRQLLPLVEEDLKSTEKEFIAGNKMSFSVRTLLIKNLKSNNYFFDSLILNTIGII